MRLMDELNANSELLNDDVDYYINREVSSFFAKNESPNFKDEPPLKFTFSGLSIGWETTLLFFECTTGAENPTGLTLINTSIS